MLFVLLYKIKAVTKMMFMLGRGVVGEALKSALRTSFKGEMNE